MNKNDKIKKLLENSVLFTEEQKTAWSAMLPKMNEQETDELLSILVDEIKELKNQGVDLINDPKLEAELLGQTPMPQSAPQPVVPKVLTPKPNNEFTQELKKEVSTPELAAHPEEISAKPAPIKPVAVPKPMPVPEAPKPVSVATKAPIIPKTIIPPAMKAPMPKPAISPIKPLDTRPMPKVAPTTAPTSGLKSLADIGSVEDLKKIQAAHLRQGKIIDQVNLIKSKIMTLAQVNRMLVFNVVSVFEQSPLYKSYVTIGANILMDADPDRTKAFMAAADKLKSQGQEALNFDEFEAMADLRKQLEQL